MWSEKCEQPMNSSAEFPRNPLGAQTDSRVRSLISSYISDIFSHILIIWVWLRSRRLVCLRVCRWPTLHCPKSNTPCPPRAFLHRRRGGEERLQTIWISFNWVPREGWGQLFLHDAFLPKRAFLLCATRGMQLPMHLKLIACFHDLSLNELKCR